jgi:hypothetical protein
LAIAGLLICAGYARRSAIEVVGNGIGALEHDGRFPGPGNLLAGRVTMAAGRDVLPAFAASRWRQVAGLPAAKLIVAAPLPRAQPGGSGSMEPGVLMACPAGSDAHARGVATGMTQQYLAGQLSVLLGRVQEVTTTEAAGRDAWSLRQAAETGPVQALGWVTVRALALTERLCWDSLTQGDTAAFTRQAEAGAALREFGVCAGLLRDA